MYERNFYKEMFQRFPQYNNEISIKNDKAKVEKIDIFKELVYLRFENDEVVKYTLAEIDEIINNDVKN